MSFGGVRRRCGFGLGETRLWGAPLQAASVFRRSRQSVRRCVRTPDYLIMQTAKRYEILDITDDVARIVAAAGIAEGMALVSAMHITASVFINDHEPGLWSDMMEWLDDLAPARPDYKHHLTGEDNADAHLKRSILGHQVLVPITNGAMDLGPWERVHYGEFDGMRRKRIVVKVMGE
jgi:secondary thiamine-phosphate synthase enzyme